MRFIKTNVEWTDSMKVAVQDELSDKLSDIVGAEVEDAEAKVTIVDHMAKVEISCNGARRRKCRRRPSVRGRAGECMPGGSGRSRGSAVPPLCRCSPRVGADRCSPDSGRRNAGYSHIRSRSAAAGREPVAHFPPRVPLRPPSCRPSQRVLPLRHIVSASRLAP